jgi:signal transduction histidine kinase
MRILLVEDDENLSEVILEQLKKEGCVTDRCGDGEAALAYALHPEHDYDVVLLDRMLPVIDGLTVVKAMRQKQIWTPVLMITGLGEVDDRIEGLDCGADDYLVKPFHITELLEQLEAGEHTVSMEETVIRWPFVQEPVTLYRVDEEAEKVVEWTPDQEEFSFRRTVYDLSGRNGERYDGVRLSFQTREGEEWELTALRPRSSVWSILRQQCGWYFVVWLVMLALMYGLSRFLIHQALRPVEDSLKSQREFIAAASHELKSPLTVIQANAEALQGAEPTQGRSYGVILEECGRMARLIRGLLTLASGDAGRWNMRIQPVDGDSLLIETWEAFREPLRGKGLDFTLKIQEERCPRVLCDRERIGQVLAILLDNAMTYACGGGRVELEGRTQGRQFEIAVIDHGPGISREERSRVFRRFYQSDPSRTAKDHFGLGLSIAKEIVEQHRGSLTLSDTPGGGCTFRLTLPLEHRRAEKNTAC